MKTKARRFWAMKDKATGHLVNQGMRPGGVPFLVEIEEDADKIPEIPPMSPPFCERVHVQVRIVAYPDRRRR
jgi:hypothetical protein